MQRLGVLVVGLLLVTACGRSEERERPIAPETTSESTGPSKPAEGAKPEVTAKLVEVDLSVFKFTPKETVLKVGEPVQFKITSKDTIHSFTIKDLGVDVELTPGAEKISEVFTPQQTGRFQITCRIHSVSAYGMEGFLVVTETGEPAR